VTVEESKPARRLWFAVLPAAVFTALAVLFWRGLSGDPSEIPSALVGQPVPEFDLPPVDGLGLTGLKAADLRQGNVTVVNIWASWCVPCRQEHPVLMELSKRRDLKLVGINYKDEPENARRFMGTLGQPFQAIGADRNGRSAVDWGVYGVPETFVVDGKGIIRYKWIGPLTPEGLEQTLLKEVEKARGG
jgi:cytochrome c biogenesis protein CcmG/thiol:disulfide interchange protein DsbE